MKFRFKMTLCMLAVLSLLFGAGGSLLISGFFQDSLEREKNAAFSSYRMAWSALQIVNGLDPQGIIEIRELILKLNRERQITVLISSHILDELARLATHYGFIDGGRMVRELSAQELEASCRKCVRVEVTGAQALARVLDGMGVEYKILSDRTADVFAQLNVSQLTLALAKEDCEVLSMQERDESLESFFINLVGGGSDD